MKVSRSPSFGQSARWIRMRTRPTFQKLAFADRSCKFMTRMKSGRNARALNCSHDDAALGGLEGLWTGTTYHI